MTKIKPKNTRQTDDFIKQAIEMIQAARQHVVRQTNSVMVFTYFQIGKLIIENEQKGSNKATYGKATIKKLSKHLTKHFGNEFFRAQSRANAIVLHRI